MPSTAITIPAGLGLAAPAVAATPEDFGALGNGAVTTGSIDADSYTLMPASGTFTPGQAVLVTGAGAGGDNLSTTVESVSEMGVVLADQAGMTVPAGTTVVWGNDDTGAINDAITALLTDESYMYYGGRVIFTDGKLYIVAGGL